jgi:hypothetical protein
MAYRKILLRRDTASNWTSEDPTLSSGEIGYETTTGRFKIGDGSTAWTSLSYFMGSLDDVGNVTITSAASGQFLKWNGTAWVNDAIDLGTDTTGNYMSGVSAGTGISVTHTPGEGSTATVGLNATLDNLSNVNAPTPSDGQFLKYVAGSSEWQPANIPTINNLDDVGDVTITSASADQFLKWNGSAWVNANIPQINALDDIADVAITSAATNDVLAWSGSAWVNVNDLTVDNLTVSGDLTVNGTTTTLNTETLAVEDNIITLNSNVSGAPSANAGIEIERGSASNVLIRWNETTDTWQITEDGTTYSDIATALDIAGVAINTLDEIGDVSISSATAGQFLKWNGTAWVNDNVPIVSVLDDVGDVDVSSKSSGQFLKWSGTAWIADNVPLISTLDDVGDVTLSSTTVGQTLAYNGSGWVNSSSIRDNEVKFLMEVI